jgi:hypothetical protein
LDLKIKIIEAENDSAGGTAGPINLDGGLKSVVVKYRLDFDNSEYVKFTYKVVDDWIYLLYSIPFLLLFSLFISS